MKKKLIHLLGGYTKEEYIKTQKDMYFSGKQRGKESAAMYIVLYARSIYGCSAQEWCDKMFTTINKFLENRGNENQIDTIKD